VWQCIGSSHVIVSGILSTRMQGDINDREGWQKTTIMATMTSGGEVDDDMSCLGEGGSREQTDGRTDTLIRVGLGNLNSSSR